MGRGYSFLTRKSKIDVRQGASVGRRAVVAVGRWGAAAVGVLPQAVEPLSPFVEASVGKLQLVECRSERFAAGGGEAGAQFGVELLCRRGAFCQQLPSFRGEGDDLHPSVGGASLAADGPEVRELVNEGYDKAGGDIEASRDVALGRGVARVYGCEQSNLFVGQAQPLHTLGKGLCYLGSGHAQAEARRLEDRHAVDVVHAKRVTL
mgnify:CR=1 FL=1